MGGWRALGIAWAAVIVAAGASVAGLQYAGPLRPAGSPRPVGTPHAAKEAEAPHAPGVTPATPVVHPPEHAAEAAVQPPAAPPRAPGTIAAPQPALLEPAADVPDAKLPRIAPDGRTPMGVYAADPPPADGRPRVALLLVGVGLSGAESRAAVDALPPAVTLGVSPYARDAEPLLAAARARGHEMLVTLPMESQGYPLNDSGPHALLTGAEPADNTRNLHWVLSRVPGAVGVSGASDGLRGERFANVGAAIGPVLGELSARGLLYVDPRPDAKATGTTLVVTTIVDDPALGPAIDAKLAELEQRARDGKPAFGLAGPLRPVTVQHIADWAGGLANRGVTLVPVTALLPRSSAH